MKITLHAVLGIFLIFLTLPALYAKEENGLRVEVQKTTISKDDSSGRDSYLDKIDRTLGLRIFAKNASMTDMGPGKIDWILIVDRWGYNPRKLERYQGSDPLPGLRVGEETSVQAGESQLGGYKNYGGQYQDKIEGWCVTISHEGKPTMIIESSSSFQRLNAKAKDAK